MDGVRKYNVKQNKSEKEKYCMISLVQNLRNKTNKQREKKREKPRNRFLNIENKLIITSGGWVK